MTGCSNPPPLKPYEWLDVCRFRGSNIAGAVFSVCDQYRYELWRRWDYSKPNCLFIMLNPSTADETKNDPTVERCQRYAKAWGYGGLTVCNLFALRATDPKVMLNHHNPIGDPINQERILDCAKNAGLVVCAWGNHGQHLGRSADIMGALLEADIKPMALKITSKGEPAHPLYLKKTLEPKIITKRFSC